ncbi:MAG: YceD family protein [Thiobacillaceae bacterium]
MLQHLCVNPAQFAAARQILQGSEPLGNFERLAQETVNPDSVLHYRIEGGRDKLGRFQLRCKLEGRIDLACQRCLEAVGHVIDSDKGFYLADTPERADQMERELAGELGFDVEVIEAGHTLDLAALIEDEVLLGLPIVPMHPEGACRPPEDHV